MMEISTVFFGYEQIAMAVEWGSGVYLFHPLALVEYDRNTALVDGLNGPACRKAARL